MKYFALSLLLLLSVHVISGEKLGKAFIELKDQIQMTTSLQTKARAELGLWKPLLTVLAEAEFPKIINDASVKSNRFELLYGIDVARRPDQLKATTIEFLRRCTAFVAQMYKEAGKDHTNTERIIANLFQLPGADIDFLPNVAEKDGEYNDLTRTRKGFDGEMWAPPASIKAKYDELTDKYNKKKGVKWNVGRAALTTGADKDLRNEVMTAIRKAAVKKVREVLGLSKRDYGKYSSRTIKALFDRITTLGEGVKMYKDNALVELERDYPGSLRWALTFAKKYLGNGKESKRTAITRASGFDFKNLKWAVDNLETLKKHDPGNADKKGLLAPPHLSWTAQARPPNKTPWDQIGENEKKGSTWFRTRQITDLLFTPTAMTNNYFKGTGIEPYTQYEKENWEFLKKGAKFSDSEGLLFGSGGNVWRLPFEVRDVTGSTSLRDWMDMINNNRLSTSAGPSGTTDEYFSAMGFFGMDKIDYYACGMRQGALSNMIMGCHHSLAEVAEGAEGPKIVQGNDGPERKPRNPILAFNPEEPHKTFEKCDDRSGNDAVQSVKLGSFDEKSLKWEKEKGEQAPNPKNHFATAFESYKAFSGEPKARDYKTGRPLPVLVERYADFSMIRKDDTEILRDGHRFRTRSETADRTKTRKSICRKGVSEYFQLLFNCKGANDEPATYKKQMGKKFDQLTSLAKGNSPSQVKKPNANKKNVNQGKKKLANKGKRNVNQGKKKLANKGKRNVNQGKKKLGQGKRKGNQGRNKLANNRKYKKGRR